MPLKETAADVLSYINAKLARKAPFNFESELAKLQQPSDARINPESSCNSAMRKESRKRSQQVLAADADDFSHDT